MKLSKSDKLNPLPEAAPKSHWDLEDCFHAGRLLGCFTHQDYEIGGHTHDFVEVNIVIRGKGSHWVRDRSFPVRAGDTFVVPPRVRHGYSEGENLDVIHILIHPAYLTQYAGSLTRQPGYTMLFTVDPFY
ncbi:MAG: AraC family ligand binding domain-containing protein, partial [Planctomycetota bacterium]